ncbi:peptide/nickel transport system permease protein [Sporobacter termitidis DSM 10068]|uniref:Peptide/nickel transport system permease protein n=1 Tax=Sporobacter termitidis DSM 10068 TaxID=1123282 RepID=A0A1M5YRM5_9FIRM|nr:ABC transporter permease [Sporobacter termitidis]SHI14514.1 peptide/nickel transport system permease protein [Sporobacter termitidis DSM 10068]
MDNEIREISCITDEETRLKAKKRRKQNIRYFFTVLFGRGILAKISFVLVCIFILVAVFCPLLTSYTPFQQELSNALKGASPQHLLGTDNLGRDLFTRIVYGARFSLSIGLLSSVWALVIGVALGLAAGYFGGIFGGLVMRLMDAQLSIPPLILALCLAAVFGGAVFSISLIIGISAVPGYVRVIYGQVLSLREYDYVEAARLIGQGNFKILFKHLLPNCFPTIIVMFTMGVGTAIMIESGLAYLGIGIKAPTPSWGVMIFEGYKYIFSSPHLALWPGIMLMLLIISLSVVGDGLRDALDPKLRGKL